MRKKIIMGLAVAGALIAALAVSVAMQPSEFRITRSLTISAAPSNVFAHVNDFHRWDAWSPWAKIDPAMKQTFEGAQSGTGDVYAWIGNNEVGEGRMTITESRPNEPIRIKLEFLKPIAAINTAEFTFTPDENRQDMMRGPTNEGDPKNQGGNLIMEWCTYDPRKFFLFGMRFFFGLWLLYVGAVKWIFIGPSSFVGFIAADFDKTWSPHVLNVALAWLIIVAEPVLAVLILSGKKERIVWTLTALLMFLLTIGQTILMKPDVAGNWQYLVLTLVCAALCESDSPSDAPAK